jgi:hypothetical protein
MSRSYNGSPLPSRRLTARGDWAEVCSIYVEAAGYWHLVSCAIGENGAMPMAETTVS